MPVLQDEQIVDEAAAYVPAAHAPVTAERPVVAQYDPAGQAEQTVDPVLVVKVPVAQLIQTEDEAIEYFPTAQVPVTAERPEVEQYDPEGQAEQTVDPVDA